MTFDWEGAGVGVAALLPGCDGAWWREEVVAGATEWRPEPETDAEVWRMRGSLQEWFRDALRFGQARRLNGDSLFSDE